MNARSTNRPGGRGRARRVRGTGAAKKSGCVLVLLALASIPALADVIWGLIR